MKSSSKTIRRESGCFYLWITLNNAIKSGFYLWINSENYLLPRPQKIFSNCSYDHTLKTGLAPTTTEISLATETTVLIKMRGIFKLFASETTVFSYLVAPITTVLFEVCKWCKIHKKRDRMGLF